ncbi:hypothetical protein [Streptomyces sp. TLI_146]|uniref:hypothetical protein n=1 Tax=Streptomyces sp. TLI_146 TaxID=1938858 RepID=UPI000C714F6B|nr:hypothetical protein [Streptomyces sp. TLI_146]PKV84242.1 hypothetical protein BX283_1754 [Streptomyces sp. TLI_146]
MRRLRELIIGAWGALSFKPAFQQAAHGRATRFPGAVAASWVPDAKRRRLELADDEHLRALAALEAIVGNHDDALAASSSAQSLRSFSGAPVHGAAA